MKLDWRQGSLYITIIGLECCWLYALLVLLNNQVADGYLSIPWLLLLYPVAFILNRLWRWRRPKIYPYIINGLASAIGALLMLKAQLYSGLGLFESAWLLALPQTLKPAILLLGGSIVSWWQGWRLARLRVTFATSVTEFQFGLLILFIVFLVTSLLGAQLADSIPIALGFFLFALAGMALARSLDSEGWLSGAHRGLWSGVLLAGIGLIMILGLFIGSVMTPDFLQLVITPFKWLVSKVWEGIVFLINLLPEPGPVELPPELMTEMPPSQPDESEIIRNIFTIPEALLSWLRSGYMVFVLGIMLVALWRISSQIFGWLRRRLATTAGAEVEPLPGAFRADLLGFLRNVVLRILRLRLPFRRKKLEPVSLENASVRQIYRQFLRWAAGNGWPRHLSQTPYEYLRTLENLLPIAQGEVRLITEQYVSARYSPSSPTEQELNQLRQSWYLLRRNRLNRPDSEHVHK